MADGLKYRFSNMGRLFATLSMSKANFYADRLEQILDKMTDEELILLFCGNKEEIRIITKTHNLPVNFMDFIGILIDGEATSTMLLKQAEVIPPRNKMH
jgi:hypothetical protein